MGHAVYTYIDRQIIGVQFALEIKIYVKLLLGIKIRFEKDPLCL